MEIILTHENADFDALASLLAAAKLHPGAIPVLPRRLNRNLRDFLAIYGDEFPFVQPQDLPRRPVERAIVVDTQNFVPVKGMSPHTRIHIVDHHPLSVELKQGMSYSGGETGATVTMLVERFPERGLVPSPIEATLMLLGIYEDTGSLSYPTTTPRDIRCAAWLLEQGANLAVVGDFLHQPLTEKQRRLYHLLIENSHSHDFSGHTVVIACAEAGEQVEELATLAHNLRDLFDPAALFVLVKMDEHIQMVARSSTPAIDVAEVASHFGGGGHSRAAAALIRDRDLEEVRESLLDLLSQTIQPAVTVGQIMSYGVHTLSPRTTVAEAAEMMRRYGHEGFPVVDKKGRLVGVLTRREIDKALHHGLGDKPISLYMYTGEVCVSPSDSVERLQAVMVEHGLGQIPVVEEGRIVGIVTRTDLIKLWGAPPRRARAAEIAALLERVLPAHLLQLLRRAGEKAEEMGYSLYLVGGFVRDLLLGLPNLDIDLVVEGDAIALARSLAKELGGRVHSHRRFGTAKWMLEESPQPLALDFATARTEFYEHPTALPQVERSSIKQDLYRRDFTVNTMAIALNPGRYGELLDFYGGELDLKRGLIRVLHNLSFVEDPTRMLRAARLAERLGFRIEERTAKLIREALDLLDRTTGERIRHELRLILQEKEPEKALCLLDELGVLRQIHPSLHCDEWFRQRCQRLRETLAQGGWELKEGQLPICYLALLTFRMGAEELRAFISRLRLTREEAVPLRQLNELVALAPRLEAEELPPSAIFRLLNPFSVPVLLVLHVATDSERVRHRVELYYRQLRHVRTEIDGNYLKSLGLKPGPLYGRILRALRDARLDGKVHTLEEEQALLEKLLEG